MAIIGKLGPMGRGGSLGLSGRVRPGHPGFMGHPGRFGGAGVNEGHLRSPSFRPPGPYNVQGGPVQRPGNPAVSQAVNQPSAQPGAPGAPGGGQGPYYDSQAKAAIVANLAAANQRIAGLQRNSSDAFTNYASTMGNLDYQQPRAQLAQMQNANRSGGLFSSAENQAQGNIGKQYLDARTQALDALGSAWTGNQTAIGGVQHSIPLFNAQKSAEATQRRAAAEAKFPGAGEGTDALVKAVAKILGGGKSGGGRVRGTGSEGPHIQTTGQPHHMPAGKPSGKPAKPPKAPPKGHAGHGYSSGGAGL